EQRGGVLQCLVALAKAACPVESQRLVEVSTIAVSAHGLAPPAGHLGAGVASGSAAGKLGAHAASSPSLSSSGARRQKYRPHSSSSASSSLPSAWASISRSKSKAIALRVAWLRSSISSSWM